MRNWILNVSTCSSPTAFCHGRLYYTDVHDSALQWCALWHYWLFCSIVVTLVMIFIYFIISRTLLLRHSAATWLCSHQLSEAEADHHQIWLADMTLRCDSSSVDRHINTEWLIWWYHVPFVEISSSTALSSTEAVQHRPRQWSLYRF